MYSYYKIEKNQIRESSEENKIGLVRSDRGMKLKKKRAATLLIYRKIFLLAPMNQRKFLD